LKEVGVLDSRQHGVGRPLELGLPPVVVEPEVFAALGVVVGVAGEDGGEQFEHVERQATDVHLLEDGGHGRLVGVLVQDDGGDVVGGRLLDELVMKVLA